LEVFDFRGLCAFCCKAALQLSETVCIFNTCACVTASIVCTEMDSSGQGSGGSTTADEEMLNERSPLLARTADRDNVMRDHSSSTPRFVHVRAGYVPLGVMVCNTPGAGKPHFYRLQTIANDVRKAEKA